MSSAPRVSRPTRCEFAVSARTNCVALAPVTASALPQDGVVKQGGATIQTPQTGVMEINQSTQTAAVDWRSFSVGKGETVNIVQPNSQAVLINRVIGYDPTRILGQINANGRVVLSNTRGVYFSSESQVNVGSLVATTLGISDADLQSGRLRFLSMIATSLVVAAFTFAVSWYLFDQLTINNIPVKGMIVTSLFDLLFFTLGGMLVFSTGIILYASLFTSPEAKFLLTTPARSDHVFTSKFQGAVAFSSWAFVVLGVPIFVAYGIAAEAPWYFYPLLPLCLLGYVLRRFGYPIAPVVVGLILGPLAEQQLRRALSISQGDLTVLVSSPISASMLAIAALAVIIPGLLRLRARARGEQIVSLAADED